jgi:hypothetical protein
VQPDQAFLRHTLRALYNRSRNLLEPLRTPSAPENMKGPETISDLGAGVPTGTLTVFPGCAGLLIGFADRLLDEGNILGGSPFE